MSGDDHNGAGLELDERWLGMVEDAAARARGIPGADTLASIFVPALVAEVRHLRAEVAAHEARSEAAEYEERERLMMDGLEP